MRLFLYAFLLLIFWRCSGVTLIDKKDVSGLYEKSFIEQITAIKEIYRNGKVNEALAKLEAIKEESLKEPERALRRNLIGVIYFSKENFEQAIYNFNLGLTYSGQDYYLTGQIKLNLASSYFKIQKFDKAVAILKEIPDDALSAAEAQKSYKLAIKLSDSTGDTFLGAIGSGKLIQVNQNLTAVRTDPLFEKFISYFNKLGQTEKKRIIEDLQKTNPVLSSYTAYLEAERSYFLGDKSEASRLLDFAQGQGSESTEIKELVNTFQSRMENFSKVDSKVIGVVLPLSGKNAEFGRRALLGIDTALKDVNFKKGKKGLERTGLDITVMVRDSQGTASIGAGHVADLIETQNVVAVIGGLSPKEAEKEYFEAKKRGTVFISLSTLFISREQKDYLLVEIPGSVEGQIEALFNDGFLQQVGKKAGIVYPKSEMGQAYLDEFWRKAEAKGVEVTGAASYNPSETDFRDLVQSMLGLRFSRMREEENILMAQIQELEKTTMRRVQVLPPQIDFDWVFVPAFPKEALQIIPTFAYFDAFNIKYLGVPSWRTGLMAKEASKNQKFLFIGDPVNEVNEEFSKKFFKLHQSYPKLIELRCYDALKIFVDALEKHDFGSRDQFDQHWRGRSKLSGFTGSWINSEGLWLKEMVSMTFDHGDVVPLNIPKTTSN